MIKIKYLDSLRGIAVLLVLLVHTNQYGSPHIPIWLNNIVSQGAIGVQLFFILSALTLYISFNFREGKEKYPIFSFLIRRFFRIAPLYYLGIIYYLYQDGLGPRFWLGDEKEISIYNILSNFSFTHGLNPYWINSVVPGGWSIAVEMSFYLILPFLYKKIKNFNEAFIFVLISLFIRYIILFFLEKNNMISSDLLWKEYLFLFFPNQLPIFALGIMLFFNIKREDNVLSGKTLILAGLFILIIHFSDIKNDIFPFHFIYAVGFYFLILGLSRKSVKFFVNNITVFIGKISFGMYIVHFGILFFLDSNNFLHFLPFEITNFVLNYLIVTALSILISYFLHIYIEQPFQKIGNKLINQLNTK